MKFKHSFFLVATLLIACCEVNHLKGGYHNTDKNSTKKGLMYRIRRAWLTRNHKATLARKTTLEWRIKRLTDYANNELTVDSVIKKLEKRHLWITLPEMKSYLAHLIDSIEWVNIKLKKLREPLIDASKLTILKDALTKMNSNNFSL